MSDFREEAEALSSEMVNWVRELVAIRTVNYKPEEFPEGGPDGMDSPGEESRVVTLVADFFENEGIPFKIFGDHPREDVVGVIGQQQEGYRRILLPTHSDVVPSGDGWTVMDNPFEMLVDGDTLYGRGVFDNKGPMAATMMMAKILKRYEDQIPGAVLIGAVHDEEVGQSAGLTELVQKGRIQATDAIVPDCGENMRSIIAAEKEVLWLKITAEGKQGHGSTPHEGVNAIVGLAGFVQSLAKAYGIRATTQGNFFSVQYQPDNRFSDGVTINVGKMKGGSAANMIPGAAEAIMDIRYPAALGKTALLNELNRVSRAYTQGGVKFGFEELDHIPPHQVSSDALVARAIEKYTGASQKGIGGRTVCGKLQAAGVNSVAWGPGNEKYFHVADEQIRISELTDFVAKAAQVVTYIANQRVD